MSEIYVFFLAGGGGGVRGSLYKPELSELRKLWRDNKERTFGLSIVCDHVSILGS